MYFYRTFALFFRLGEQDNNTGFLAAWSGCTCSTVFLNYTSLIFPLRFTIVAQAPHRMDSGLDCGALRCLCAIDIYSFFLQNI